MKTLFYSLSSVILTLLLLSLLVVNTQYDKTKNYIGKTIVIQNDTMIITNRKITFFVTYYVTNKNVELDSKLVYDYFK